MLLNEMRRRDGEQQRKIEQLEERLRRVEATVEVEAREPVSSEASSEAEGDAG